MQHSFHHLIDYDCRYYTYIHSQMLVKALAERFLAPGCDLPSAGLEYRRAILERGATKDARELVEGYLGPWWNAKAFWRWLEEKA
jgi:thimet oligopeptidase